MTPWSHLSSARRLAAGLNMIAVIAGGLALDAILGWPGQIAAIVWTVIVFSWLYQAGGTLERRLLVLCMAISGVGEVFLSLIWGLYEYQFHNVPLFVPPGHALLMTLGLLCAPRLPRGGVTVISAIGAAWAAYAWVAGFDRLGTLLFGIYAFCMIAGRARPLYATMFVIALAMELYGTALGNWAWVSQAPWLHLRQANPPFSAGAFYCMLDLLVLAALTRLPALPSSTSGTSTATAD